MGARIYRLTVSSGIAVITGLLAQLMFRVGPVPYTMQNTGVILSGLLLPPRWALLSQLVYILLIAVGAPLAAGFRGGVGVLLGPTSGYLAAFPIAAFAMAAFRESYERATGRSFHEACRHDLVALWALSCVASIPIYLLGYAVFLRWALVDPRLADWAVRTSQLVGVEDAMLALLTATVLIFLPQDFVMDHVLALLVAWRVARQLPREYTILTRGRS